MPAGVWISENPFLMLYIDYSYTHPERRSLFLGFYGSENQASKIYLLQSTGVAFHVMTSTTTLPSGERMDDLARTLFSGNWETMNSQLVLIRRDNGQRITLNRIYDYDSINPLDWFPQLQSIGDYR